MFDRIWESLAEARQERSGGAPSKAGIMREIHRLEEKETTDRIVVARLWNRLGTIAESTGDPETAAYMGRAIDAYLEGGYFDAAAAMCRRLIRHHPEVVRARCTLAFLSLARRDLGDAVQEITEYTIATKRSGTERFAVPRLGLMAQATIDPVVLRCIATALRELGDRESADALQDRIRRLAESEAPPQLTPQSESDRWERLLAIALLDREQLRRHAPHQAEAIPESVWDASDVWSAA